MSTVSLYTWIRYDGKTNLDTAVRHQFTIISDDDKLAPHSFSISAELEERVYVLPHVIYLVGKHDVWQITADKDSWWWSVGPLSCLNTTTLNTNVAVVGDACACIPTDWLCISERIRRSIVKHTCVPLPLKHMMADYVCEPTPK